MSDSNNGRFTQRYGRIASLSFDSMGNPVGEVGLTVFGAALTGGSEPARYSVSILTENGGYDMTIEDAEALVEMLTAATARLKALKMEEVRRER